MKPTCPIMQESNPYCTNILKKECYLKSILEEDKVYQDKDNLRALEPEVIIRRLDHQFTFYRDMFLCYLMS